MCDEWISVQETSGALRPVPAPELPNTGLDLKAFQNLGYTGEWFGFAGFMWFRFFRREVTSRREGAAAEPAHHAPVAPLAPVSSRREDRTADARKDRQLKIVAAVLGTAVLALIVRSGTVYIAGRTSEAS